MAFCLLVSLLPMQPSAVALPNSQPVGASGKASRVVPIFNSANSQQAVMTGYLYSSRIVFAIDPASGSQDFYVGLPKSLASTTGGRVKVAEVFTSQSNPANISNFSLALNRFAVFVLEKDLIAATPAELLTPEMDIGSKGDFPGVTTAYSYGEYQNRNSPGSQKPCEGGPCSKDVRSLQLKILALKGKPPVSVMPNFRDQFIGQIILENSVDRTAGIACYGDGGAPVVASYRNRELYMGAIADQFYVKACGAFPQATYDKDGKMITFGYDTDIAINFISPVYKHTDLINRAKEYAKTLVTPSPTPLSEVPGAVFIVSSIKQFPKEIPIKMLRTDIPISGFRIYSSIGGSQQQVKNFSTEEGKCKYENSVSTKGPSSCDLPIPSFTNQFKFELGKSIWSVAAFNQNGEGPRSEPLEIQLCSKYIFIGMRGSGQKYEADPLGIGITLTNLFNAAKIHPKINGDISADGVKDYPAVPVPFNLATDPKLLPNFVNETVNHTTLHLAKRFNDIRKACPDAKLILAGYSQGAYGINDFINILERNHSKDELQAVIAGVFLIANPAEDQRGIIPTLDVYAKSKVLEKAGLALCATNAGLKRFVERETSKGFAAFNKITNVFKGIASGKDLKEVQQSAKDWDQWQKDFDKNSKNKSVKDLPGCQLLWTSILLSAVERKLTPPVHVKTESFFYDGDIVADFCKIVFNPAESLEGLMCFGGGGDTTKSLRSLITDQGAQKVLKKLSLAGKALEVFAASKIHTDYAVKTDWANKVVTDLFAD